MELMPHIKALLDDLVKMTKHIDVKRSDLADKYEDNTRTVLLYQQASEILHGMPSFYTYNVYPREVLSSYGRWVKTDNISEFGIIQPLTSSKNIVSNMSSGSKMTISNSAPLENGSIGDGWVKLVEDGNFYTTKQYEVKTKTFNYKISKPDNKGNFNSSDLIPTFIFNGTLQDSKNINIYIKDEKYNKYVKINISFIGEYIEKPDNIDDLKYSNNASYIYDYDTKLDDYVTYIRNTKNKNEMIIKDINIISDPEKEYLFRYKILFYFSDNNYYNNNEHYFNKDEDVDKTKYRKIDNNEYYQSDIDIYSLLYTKNDNGNYIYNSDNNSFEIVDNDKLSEINSSDLYIKEKELLPRESIYYRYADLNDGLVTQEQYSINGQKFNRYETIDNNFVTYYAYGNEQVTDTDKCIIATESITNTIQFRTYLDIDNTEIPIRTDNQILYYFYPDQQNGNYRREFIDENTYRYVKSLSNTDDKYSDKYSMVKEVPIIDHDTCIYINSSVNNEYYLCEKVLTDYQVSLYYNDRNKIPDISYIDIHGKEKWLRDDLKDRMKDYILNMYCPDYNNEDYSIPIYTGETNRYYRELNGLPPLNVSLYHPKIDRYKINPYYKGTNVNPYLFELTDAEIDKMEELGYLKQYQDMYPDYTYLRHLGKHRIDVIDARNAAPYDILHLDDSEMGLTSEMFIENYSIAKNYIFKRYYKPNMFGVHEYYHAYIGFNICILALIMCIVKSGEILIENKFIDKDTVDLVLKSYGFDHTFDSIPLVYRREIAKNILKLIRNKGIDKIYETIYDLFNIGDIEVYKYYFKKSFIRDENNILQYYVINEKENKKLVMSKTEYETNKDKYIGWTIKPVYDVGISQVPISSNNVAKDIMNDSNRLNYADITDNDKYWGVYESKDSVKDKILNIPFNYINSKYVTLNNKFNLSELNFNSAYLLNYLHETTTFRDNPIMLDIEEINTPQNITNLLVTLFAIQSIKYGFDGNIPSDIVSAATVYKFNLDETIVGDNGKAKRIIDYYLNYMTQKSAINALDVNTLMNYISQKNHETNSIEGAIYNDKTDKSVGDIAETYLKNISKDDTLTKINEASLYNTLVSLRENSKTLNDFMCFDNLLHCIGVCEETKEAYKFNNIVWEKMYECKYSHSGDINDEHKLIKDSAKMYYTDILHSWTLVKDLEKENILSQVDANSKKLIRLIDDTYIDADNYIIESKDGKNYIYELIANEKILTDLEPYDTNYYYEHFLSAKNNVIITSRNPITYSFDVDEDIIINISNISRLELLQTEDILTIANKIDVYKKEYLFDKSKLDLDLYINDLIYLDYSDDSENQQFREIAKTNIGINNTAYIGNLNLDDFINLGNIENGPIMYVEVLKNNDTSENIYEVKIYKKCEYALTYAMYLREMAPDLYNYLQLKTDESNSEYMDRISKFSSTIIATIENNIESKKIKEQIHLSYVDFSNISKYIKLIINVFKSYSIDLSSMDIIYNIDDKNNNRIKMIDMFTTNEKYDTTSAIRLESDISYKEKSFIKDIFTIKDELYIDYRSKQLYDDKS